MKLNRTRGALVAGVVLALAWLASRPFLRDSALPEPPSARVRGRPVEPTCPDVQHDAYYFPAGTFALTDEFFREWYSEHLRSTGQASLTCGGAATLESYRFTYLRSFRTPIVASIEVTPPTASFAAWETNGRGGYKPGDVIKTVRRELSADERAQFTQRLELADVWALDSVVDSTMNDGAEWVIEVRRRGVYRVVTRRSPRSGPYRELGLFFIRASGFVNIPGDLY